MSDVNPCISQDIWFEIFKELPVKTLGKCRCVCKSWHSLIVSSSFMASHLKHYTQNESNSLLLYKDISEFSESRQYEHCVIVRDTAQLKVGNSCLYTSICPFILCDGWCPHFHLVGSIYGLLCLSDHAYLSSTDRIMLWNPILQKSIKLPLLATASDYSVTGFGFDSSKNDHKVVKLSQFHVEGILITNPFVGIYSVKEQAWRMIYCDYLVDNCICRISSSNCFLNGVIHWLTLKDEAGIIPFLDKWVLLFNVADESFDKMELPEALLRNTMSDYGVFVFQNKISVSRCRSNFWNLNSATSCQIWVKREYNVTNSWCQILNVSLYDCCHKSHVQYFGKNELLGFAKRSTRELVSYDSKTAQTKALGLISISESTAFCEYSESLVLLDQQIDAETADELHRSADNRDSFFKLLFGDEEVVQSTDSQ